MARSRVLKRKTSGCCWRKLLGKALKRNPTVLGESNTMPNNSHQCFDQDEIVYLNLYLTSLEKKLQAIEEITKLKWYSQRMRRATGDSQDCIRSGFQFFTEGACKPLLQTTDGYCSELSTYGGAPQKREVLRGDSETIIREIISLGTKNYRQDYASLKWAELIAPKQDLFTTVEPRNSETNKEKATEALATSQAQYTEIGRYHVGAMCYPTEIHVATEQENAVVPTPEAKASCSIELFDNEAKTIEISYDNREWGKKGTIVLRDIENQIGVQTELIGRVVCFLLGMGEVDLA